MLKTYLFVVLSVALLGGVLGFTLPSALLDGMGIGATMVALVIVAISEVKEKKL